MTSTFVIASAEHQRLKAATTRSMMDPSSSM